MFSPTCDCWSDVADGCAQLAISTSGLSSRWGSESLCLSYPVYFMRVSVYPLPSYVLQSHKPSRLPRESSRTRHIYRTSTCSVSMVSIVMICLPPLTDSTGAGFRVDLIAKDHAFHFFPPPPSPPPLIPAPSPSPPVPYSLSLGKPPAPAGSSPNPPPTPTPPN